MIKCGGYINRKCICKEKKKTSVSIEREIVILFGMRGGSLKLSHNYGNVFNAQIVGKNDKSAPEAPLKEGGDLADWENFKSQVKVVSSSNIG